MKQTQQGAMAKQKGAVSLFIVIFTSLLITTVTISFMQIMVRDQQQAMNSDLSESAYDSAIAGVEDAKRALLLQQECLGDTTPRCNDINAAIAAGECTTLSDIAPWLGGSAGTGGETKIRQSQSASDDQLQQAYTCVKIKPSTGDYLGSFDSANTVAVVPLRSQGDFDRIIISWSQNKGGGPIDLPAGGIALPNTGTATWPQNRPALLRAQLINGAGHTSISLSDLDGSTFSNTLFLYPSQVGLKNLQFVTDSRRGGLSEPQRAFCRADAPSGSYACEVEIETTGVITPTGSQLAYLGLAAFYNPTDYKIELRDSRNPDPNARVNFDGVQPEVDSTGRANDLFRRVVSRVELGNTFTYPIAALETSGNLCKDFSVTTETDGYVNNCSP